MKRGENDIRIATEERWGKSIHVGYSGLTVKSATRPKEARLAIMENLAEQEDVRVLRGLRQDELTSTLSTLDLLSVCGQDGG